MKHHRHRSLCRVAMGLVMLVGGAQTARAATQAAPPNATQDATPNATQDATPNVTQAATPKVTQAATLIQQKRSPPVAFAVLLNPVETGVSALVNKLVLVSPVVLLGDGRGACVINPQAYALTDGSIGGGGALVGFRIFSGQRYDGLYFGVRFGGGVGNQSFKTFMGQVDAGYSWAFGAFRVGLGLNAGGGYMAYRKSRGSLYLFSLDVSMGFAMGRFGQGGGPIKEPPAAK